jgi:hypothetical protein
VNRELVALAKKNFHGFGCEVTVPRTDIDNERIQPAGGAWQGLAKTRINRLSNEMFDDGTMGCRCCHSHKDKLTLAKF